MQALPSFQAQPPEMAFVALRMDRHESFRVIELLRPLFTQMMLIIMVAQERPTVFKNVFKRIHFERKF
jgi:ActR/RegA family two-component response regulator